jgi:outer membrane receptor protein involved in Fe transport
LITTALPGQAEAGSDFTCAVNVDGSGNFIAGSTCAPLNIFDPSILIGGHMPDAVYNYLYRDEVDHTTYKEETITLNLNGTLFDLPAGPLAAAIGYEHRYDYINDVPSLAAQNATLYNYSSAGITTGSDVVDEIYGELNIPLVKDKPFFEDLELNLSGRYTHYRSYGSDFTYHINGQWAPSEVIRFRANYGTSFRAPNLFEQFVADQTGYYGGGVDPCNGFATAYAVGTTRYNNCLAALTPILGNAGALNFINQNSVKVITQGGAKLGLDAETSKSWGVGGILTIPREIADISFAVDYWNITVSNEVYTLGNIVLDRCYDSTDFPNNKYCDLIAPRLPAGDRYAGTLDYFNNPYLNVARQKASGIDFDLRYQTGLWNGKFVLKVQATRNLHQIFQLFSTDTPVDYNGTLGYQGAGAGPKWVGKLDIDYTFPGDKVRIHYGLTYVGKQDSTDLIGPFTAPFGLGPVNTDFVAQTYWKNDIAVQYKFDQVGTFTLGVDNLFDVKPPTVSQVPASNGLYTRIGNFFNSSNYDYYGRQVFVNFTRTFR